MSSLLVSSLVLSCDATPSSCTQCPLTPLILIRGFAALSSSYGSRSPLLVSPRFHLNCTCWVIWTYSGRTPAALCILASPPPLGFQPFSLAAAAPCTEERQKSMPKFRGLWGKCSCTGARFPPSTALLSPEDGNREQARIERTPRKEKKTTGSRQRREDKRQNPNPPAHRRALWMCLI